MKTKTMYEIRSYTEVSSKSMSAKLRTPAKAAKLVKRLRKMGFQAYKAAYKIAA
jgi:hypothetical protein